MHLCAKQWLIIEGWLRVMRQPHTQTPQLVSMNISQDFPSSLHNQPGCWILGNNAEGARRPWLLQRAQSWRPKEGGKSASLCWGFELNTAYNLSFVLFSSIFIFVTVKGNF